MLIRAALRAWVEWIIDLLIFNKKNPLRRVFFYHFIPMVKRRVPPVSFSDA